MSSKLHHLTLKQLDHWVWKKPGKNLITAMIEHSLDLDKRPDGHDLVLQLNQHLQSTNFTRRQPADTQHDPLQHLRKNFSGHFSITFKNTYQFAAFTLLAHSGCRKEETDRIEEVLGQLKPDFMKVEPGIEWGQGSDEDGSENGSDPEIEVQLIFECTPDNIIRSKYTTSFEGYEKLFQQRDYFEQGVKVVEYFMDDPFEEIPEVVLRNYFSPGMADRLSNTHPNHPFLTTWIRWVIEHGSAERFGRSTFLDYMSEKDRADPEVVRSFVRHNGMELEHASETLKRDPSIVSLAVSRNGRALEHAHESLQRHPEIVRLALGNDPTAIEWVDITTLGLDNYLAFFQAALKKKSRTANRISHALYRTTPELLDLAVLADASILQHGSAAYRSSREKARQILPKAPLALQYFEETIRSDRELVSLAIQKNALAFELASAELRRDEALIEATLMLDKKSFVFIPKDLCPSRETLLRWIGIQPLLVLHFGLLNSIPFDEEIQRVYISATQTLKNQDILDLPQTAGRSPFGDAAAPFDIEDLF